MPSPQRPDPRLDGPVALAALALLLFASPLATLWSRLEAPWYLPYGLWLLVIVLAAWLQFRRSGHEP